MPKKTIPELARMNKALHRQVDDLLLSYCQLEHTMQLCAQLAMQANGDQNLDGLSKQSAADLERAEDLLSQAAFLYMGVATRMK